VRYARARVQSAGCDGDVVAGCWDSSDIVEVPELCLVRLQGVLLILAFPLPAHSSAAEILAVGLPVVEAVVFAR